MAKQDVPLSVWKQYITRSESVHTLKEIGDTLFERHGIEPIATGGLAYVHHALKGILRMQPHLTPEQALAQIRYNKDVDVIVPSEQYLDDVVAALNQVGFEKRVDQYAKPESPGQLRRRLPGKIKYHGSKKFEVPKGWSHNEVDQDGMIHRHIGVDIMFPGLVTEGQDHPQDYKDRVAKDILEKSEKAEEFGAHVRAEPLRNLIADKLLYFKGKGNAQTKDAADVVNLLFLYQDKFLNPRSADLAYITKLVGGRDKLAKLLKTVKGKIETSCGQAENVVYNSLGDLAEEQDLKPYQGDLVNPCLLLFNKTDELPVVDALIEKLSSKENKNQSQHS